MRKTVKVDIPYFDKGKEKKYTAEIKFISNGVVRDFSEHLAVMSYVQELWGEVQELTIELITARKEQRKDIKQKIKEKKKEIERISGSAFFHKRHDITCMILDDNNVQEPVLRDFKFWDRKVEPTDWINFLYSAVYKDVDGKKKALTKQSSTPEG